MMFRAYQVGSRVALLVLAIAFIRTADAQKQSSRSPHGPLAVPCENCHTSTSWAPIRAVPEFNHDSTRYPLRGMHEKVYCTECHFRPVFTDVGKNCADCHADIHRRQFGANCAQCHTVSGWNVSVQAVQNHFNRFPLLGAHAVVQCEECHKGAAVGQYLGLSTACSSCHMADFQKTATIGGSVPNHVTSSFFSGPCEACHTSVDTWQTVTFNHALTGFPLTNGHANVPCESCHVNNNYHLTTTLNECGNSGCQLTTWQQTNNPVHSTAGTQFAAANCAVCHNTVSWTTAIFDHSQTGFALTGMHISPSPTPCVSCHVSNNYTLTAMACYGCHLTDWQNTATLGGAVPNHITAGFPQDCSICHSTMNWTGSTFNHNTTGFALTGMHISPVPTPCISCHASNNYKLASAACYGCHDAAWQSTTKLGPPVPNHITAGYPTTCESCHTTTSWMGAVFDHSTTGFALTGMHVSPTPTACVSCHTSSARPPADCYSCHTAQWQSTATMGGSVPNHLAADAAAAGILQTTTACQTCHTTTSWLGATMTHAWFNLNHGGAGGVCVTCHTNSLNAGATYTVFQCTICHGNGNAANFGHPNVTGYVYNSVNCYQCHSRG